MYDFISWVTLLIYDENDVCWCPLLLLSILLISNEKSVMFMMQLEDFMKHYHDYISWMKTWLSDSRGFKYFDEQRCQRNDTMHVKEQTVILSNAMWIHSIEIVL